MRISTSGGRWWSGAGQLEWEHGTERIVVFAGVRVKLCPVIGSDPAIPAREKPKRLNGRKTPTRLQRAGWFSGPEGSRAANDGSGGFRRCVHIHRFHSRQSDHRFLHPQIPVLLAFCGLKDDGGRYVLHQPIRHAPLRPAARNRIVENEANKLRNPGMRQSTLQGHADQGIARLPGMESTLQGLLKKGPAQHVTGLRPPAPQPPCGLNQPPTDVSLRVNLCTCHPTQATGGSTHSSRIENRKQPQSCIARHRTQGAKPLWTCLEIQDHVFQCTGPGRAPKCSASLNRLAINLLECILKRHRPQTGTVTLPLRLTQRELRLTVRLLRAVKARCCRLTALQTGSM